MARTPMQVMGRIAVLAAGTVACAAMSSYLVIASAERRLVLRLDLNDWKLLFLWPSVIAFPFVLLILWPVRLVRAIPIVMMTCAMVSLISGQFAGPMSLFVVLFAGVGAMIYCRSRAQ
ncbi:MAG: hypothetical protein JNJ88_04105 [Planctomycetes bacterium]|nr:hypothetical protein [Planctomycetota bacterium]